MSSKIIKITDTTLRDAHQSLFATRFNNDTISELAPLLDNAGYDVLEVWGGATFDSCIRYLNEDPWDRLKMINRLTPNTKLSMLLRGANLVGYKHYSNEIIQEFITVSADFGIDVFRVFDALNDINNLKDVASAVKNTGKHLQLTLCYSVGESGKLEKSKNEIYTLDYYLSLANKFVEMGADSLCIKDMAGLLSPYDASILVSELKKTIRKTYQSPTMAPFCKDEEKYHVVKIVTKEKDGVVSKEEELYCSDGRKGIDTPSYWELFAQFYYRDVTTPEYCRYYSRKNHAFKSFGKVCLNENGEWKVK